MSGGRRALTAMVPSLSDKFKSADSDLRIMALVDLNKELQHILNEKPAAKTSSRAQDPSYTDETAEKILTEMVLGLLGDSNAEVKNAAAACLASMSRKARPNYLRQIVATVTEGIGSPGEKVDEESRDICCLALKNVVAEMPVDAPNTPESLTLILTRIRQNVNSPQANRQLASELLQILADIYARFGNTIASNAKLQDLSLSCFLEVMSSAPLSVRKRAVPALASFISICPQHFQSLKSEMSQGFNAGGDTAKAWVAAVAGIAKTSAAADVGALIANDNLVDVILKQADDLEDADAVEGALTALETLALHCPSELSPHVPKIVERALQLVKYDPNYVDFDEDDVDMDDEDDLDDDDEFDHEYSDDDDDSWKIRRSAAKLLTAIISTRVDLLQEFYKTAAPILVARFAEREESVRLEVIAAFNALLQQTANARSADLAASGRNKRKRSEGMDEDSSPDSITAALLTMRSQIVKAILKQTAAKTVATRQESFVLLRRIVEALDGGLESEADMLCQAAKGALRSSDSTTPSLTIAVLTFLAAFFNHHVARSYAEHLSDLTTAITRCMKDKLQRVNFEAFATASALGQSLRPVHPGFRAGSGSASPLRQGYDGPVRQLFQATAEVLGATSVDGDVRERALITMGDLLVHEGDALSQELSSALELIKTRLSNESTASTATVVIGRLAESPLVSGPAFDAWLLDVLQEIVVSIRRNKRSASKAAEFTTLERILKRVGSALPAEVANGIILELQPFIDTPAALRVVALVLQDQPASRASVEQNIVPEVLNVIRNSATATLIDELPSFFATYVAGDPESALRLVPTLIMNVTKGSSADSTLSRSVAFQTTAKCIGAVVATSQRNTSGILSTFQKTLESKSAATPELYLALLSIGEIGREEDLCGNGTLFADVLKFFNNESEEVRTAAAFAAGNMAAGSPETLLPQLIQQIHNAKDEAGRSLLLYALKEVILNSSPAELEKLTDILWGPLFGDVAASGAAAAVSDDGIRNIKAACIGKLTAVTPARFIPQLQTMLQSTPQQRALVAASIRYTLIDSSSASNEIIAPIVNDCLTLMADNDLVVRRLAVAALNAAAQNKPYLVVDKLSQLQPYLYRETEIKPELQREVQMGPFKVIEDDGLENRKTAYEAMYTMLASCFNKIDVPAFTERVMAALRDVNEIKSLGLMLLLRLANLAPAAVVPKLDEAAESLKTIMKNLEVKDDTIKQDLERKEEMQRSTLRTAIPLFNMSTPAQAPVFHQFVSALLKLDQWKEFRDYQT